MSITVSKSTNRRRSVTSAVFHDADDVLHTRQDSIHEIVAEEDQIDRDETTMNEQMNPVMVPVSSTNKAVSSMRTSSAQNVESSRVSVQRPSSATVTTNATTKVLEQRINNQQIFLCNPMNPVQCLFVHP